MAGRANAKLKNGRERSLYAGTDKRYVRRDETGRFLEVNVAGRSLSQDIKSKSKVKYIRNSGKPWTKSEINQLRELAKANTPTRVIGLKLGRTEDAIRSKAGSVKVSLKPTKQASYDLRKK